MSHQPNKWHVETIFFLLLFLNVLDVMIQSSATAKRIALTFVLIVILSYQHICFSLPTDSEIEINY